MTSDIWVWAWLRGDTSPTLAGRFRHTRLPGGSLTGYRGEFVYGASYLGNPDKLALDPLQLPIVGKVFETTRLEGFFGTIRDAMPDDWGRLVIDRRYGPPPDPTGYLLLGMGDQVGNLGFSAMRDQPPHTPQLPRLELVNAARALMRGLEQDRPIKPPEGTRVSLPIRVNTNMGGARPKFTIEHERKQWIAKFPAIADRGAPIARIERAMLTLASACGINAANAQVVADDILLVERFDRALSVDGTGWRRDAFLSAQTVFQADPALQEYSFSGSYGRLALEMAKFSESVAADREELYRRMVFNCCISNTDDHERNHGFIADDTPGFYRLSPAYDMVPRQHNTERRYQALAIGDEGHAATRENILSNCTAFGLHREQAMQILEFVEATVQQQWRQRLSDVGLTDQQIDEWSVCFKPLPDTFD